MEHASGDPEKRAELLQLLESIEGTGIIYAATVKHVEEITEYLEREGFDVLGYHGRLPAKRRHDSQERFMRGELKAMVATNAFGMGIDKADIRFVIHYDMPGSLESYYQEAGRAGRDGEAARCVLLYDSKDRRTQLFLLGGRFPTENELRRVYQALTDLVAEITPVSAAQLQERAAPVAKAKTRVALARLKEAGVVREDRPARYSLARRGIEGAELAALAVEWQRGDERDREKLDRMEAYARTALCGWRMLQDYFADETVEERCGVCDNCRRGLAKRAEDAEQAEGAEAVGQAETRPTSGHEAAFAVGDQVSLPRFGPGKVEAIDGDSIVVRFSGGRSRKFKREFARLVHR